MVNEEYRLSPLGFQGVSGYPRGGQGTIPHPCMKKMKNK